MFKVWWCRFRGRLSGSVVKLASGQYVNTSVVLQEFFQSCEVNTDSIWRLTPKQLVRLAVKCRNLEDAGFEPVLIVNIRDKITVVKHK